MGSIWFVNEFGAGLGHVNNLAVLGRTLQAEGRPRFVLTQLDAQGEIRRLFGATSQTRPNVVWQPQEVEIAARGIATQTLADSLGLFGFADPERLREAVKVWHALAAETQPDLIVADFAPSVRLALQGRVPMVVVGGGYSIPPASRVLPPIRAWSTHVPAASRALEARILASVNLVRAEQDGAAVDHLADLFQGEDMFVCSVAAFDPYRAYRVAPPHWPFVLPGLACGSPLAERPGPEIFVYLPARHFALGFVLDCLGALGWSTHVYVSDGDPEALAARCRSNIAIHRSPVDFAWMLPRCKLLVHHAGLITACAGLACGTPQLVLPMRLEHMTTARGLVELGVGLALPENGRPDAETIRATLERLRSESGFEQAALRIGAHLAGLRPKEPCADILAACRRHLAD